MIKHIMLADDERHVTDLLSRKLEENGYIVKVVFNGKQALDWITAKNPVDLLITDITMPVMSGKELCEEIYKRYPKFSFKIMIVSSRIEHEHREWSDHIPNTEFIDKPISIKRLLEMLRKQNEE